MWFTAKWQQTKRAETSRVSSAKEFDFHDLDIYVLLKEATVSSLEVFISRWCIGLSEPTEYVVRLPDDSYLELGNRSEFFTP